MVRAAWVAALALALIGCNGGSAAPSAPTPASAPEGGSPGFACVPQTCSELNTCGEVSDGCGHSLSCGACPDGGGGGTITDGGTGGSGGGTDGGTGSSGGETGAECTGGGGDDTSGGGSGGATRWVLQEDFLSDLAADRCGDLFVWHMGSRSLEKFDSTGHSLWTKPLSNDGPDYGLLRVSPLGNLLLAGNTCSETWQGPCGELRKLDPSGNLVWKQSLGLVGVDGMAVDSHGATIVLEGGDSAAKWVAKYNYDGTLAWRQWLDYDARGVATDADDHVIVVGGIIQREPTNQETPFILELDAGGTTLWLKTLDGVQPTLDLVGTSAKGTIVAEGTLSGSFSWGSEQFSPNAQAVLVVAEASGAPRFARVVPAPDMAASATYPRTVLAVDPAGKAVLAHSGESHTEIAEYDLAGDLLWTKELDGGHREPNAPPPNI
jgi:hypothetical protein